jgi:hypothetical protein
MVKKIKLSIEKFNLDLSHKNVLTEAASGNYVITPIIAAIAGATVIAITRDSKYATVEKVKKETYDIAKIFNVENMITIVTDKNEIDFKDIDVVTNTGFVRPIDTNMIDQLSSNCVIPLMWEPWEYRKSDLDLDYCNKKGIKVYGTNESDKRLQTMKYIGFTVLSFLLDKRMTSFSTKVLILSDSHFSKSIIEVLKLNNYEYDYCNNYEEEVNLSEYRAIVVAENEDNRLLIGEDGFINKNDLVKDHYIIHISGNVDFDNIECEVNIETPAKFGYMSFTTDYIDNQAVIDLHTAGLKVAEGMLKANKNKFDKLEYKEFMELNYPALAFSNKMLW